MKIDPRNIEVIDDDMACVLSAKTGGQRLRIASDMFDYARKMLIAKLRADHRDWSQHQIVREAARRLSHGAV